MRLKDVVIASMALLLGACSAPEGEHFVADSGGMMRLPYLRIDEAEAQRMMEQKNGYIILDVGSKDEYDAGHIPGAVSLPADTIGTERPEELADLYQTILLYSRDAEKGRKAAEKLGNMGYCQVYEFGVLHDWTGPVETGAESGSKGEPAVLSFSSFSGGGPSYSVSVADPDILSCSSETVFDESTYGMPGAGYQEVYTFSGLRPGTTTVTVTASFMDESLSQTVYTAVVDESLNVALTLREDAKN